MSGDKRATRGNAEESGIIFSRNKITNTIDRIAFTCGVQVGLPGSPRDLQLIGSISYNSTAIRAQTGSKFELDKTSTYFLIEPVGSPGTVTAKLTSSPRIGQTIVVKDYKGKSQDINIIVESSNPDHTIEGDVSRTINSKYGSLMLSWNGSEWFEPLSSTSRSILTFGATSTAVAATRYLRPGSPYATGTSSAINLPSPTRGTIRNLVVLQNTAGTSGGSDDQLDYTVTVNGASTSISVSVDCASTDVASDTTHTAFVEIGDKISIEVVSGADVASSPNSIVATIEIVS